MTDISILNELLAPIKGLNFEENWRIENGDDSFVIPFPTVDLVSLVFHGEKKFEYGHYGIHLGQEDRLTFLGDSNKTIKAFFIDCRADSDSLHKRIEIEFEPTSSRLLNIPTGVAHTFSDLQNVFTVNSYNLYLPNPEDWLNGKSNWSIESDVVNVQFDAKDDELPSITQNKQKASSVFSKLIANNQKESFPKLKHEYPFTEKFNLENGESVTLQLKKQTKQEFLTKPNVNFTIGGVEWVEHVFMKSGDNSGFISLLDESPFYVVDHGTKKYSHDAYGIHICAQDRLTFLGPSSNKVVLKLVDCRKNSLTLHKEETIEFYPTPYFYLKIPNGVAHKFSGLENVFTVNRSVIFTDNESTYNPANDVIDWPENDKNYPTLEISNTPVSEHFYKKQAENQRKLIQNPSLHSTPMVFLTKDENGENVKIALRKKVENGTQHGV